MQEPPTSVPSLSPAEMQILVSRTGLALNPGQVADLVLAWRQLAVLIDSIPRDRPLADDLAVGFRLPPAAPPAVARKAKAPPPAPKRSSVKPTTTGRKAKGQATPQRASRGR